MWEWPVGFKNPTIFTFRGPSGAEQFNPPLSLKQKGTAPSPGTKLLSVLS